MGTITSGSWRRIGDNSLGFGVRRYEDSDKKPLWRFQITRNCNDPLIDIDLRAKDIIEIQKFCESALEDLRTDGGRNADKAKAA
jgi:hypothetical protein